MIIPQLYLSLGIVGTLLAPSTLMSSFFFFFVKEKVAESLISIEHTPTASMLADPLTKDLPICVFQEHVPRMELLGT